MRPVAVRFGDRPVSSGTDNHVCAGPAAGFVPPAPKQVSIKTSCFSPQPSENKQPVHQTTDNFSRCNKTPFPDFYSTILPNRIVRNLHKTKTRRPIYPSMLRRLRTSDRAQQLTRQAPYHFVPQQLSQARTSTRQCFPSRFRCISFKTKDRRLGYSTIFRGVFGHQFSNLQSQISHFDAPGFIIRGAMEGESQ